MRDIYGCGDYVSEMRARGPGDFDHPPPGRTGECDHFAECPLLGIKHHLHLGKDNQNSAIIDKSQRATDRQVHIIHINACLAKVWEKG